MECMHVMAMGQMGVMRRFFVVPFLQLIRNLCHKRGIDIQEERFPEVEASIPELLTPGAAEALAVKIYRLARTQSVSPVEALRSSLTNYRNPVPLDILQQQIRLAVKESSDFDFVPPFFARFDEPGIVTISDPKSS